MDNLRWILLFVGLGLIGLMLAWHTWRTWPRKAPRRAGRNDAGEWDGDDEAPVHVRAPAATRRHESDDAFDFDDPIRPHAEAADSGDIGSDTRREPRGSGAPRGRRGDEEPARQATATPRHPAAATTRENAHLPAGSLDDPLFRDAADSPGTRPDASEWEESDVASVDAAAHGADDHWVDDDAPVLKVEDDEIRGREPVTERRSPLGDWTSRLQSTLQRLRPQGMPKRGGSPRKTGPSTQAPSSSDATHAPAVSDGDSGFDEFGVSAPRVIGRRSGVDTGADEKILLLHVVALPNRPFTGIAVDASLRRVGLEAGAMDIFHRYPEGPAGVDRAGVPLVSVANMVAPGTLAPEDLSELSTPGLALFVQVHRVDDPFAAFLALLETADALKRELNAAILDVNRATATNQTLAAMREDMQRWLLQHRPDVLRQSPGRP